jgi:molybdopterin-guanine dinucleotide biosynthesis protein A
MQRCVRAVTQETSPLPLSVVVLVGGRGERLGGDKATLQLAGQPLLHRVLTNLRPLSDDMLVVLRADQTLEISGARAVVDVAPDVGVLAGMIAGLESARYDWALIVACDMPFVNVALVRFMFSQRDGYAVVVPHIEAGYEPLHALYHRSCLPAMWQALREGRRRPLSFYPADRVRVVGPAEIASFDPLGRSFYNINTPQERAQAEAWLATMLSGVKTS